VSRIAVEQPAPLADAIESRADARWLAVVGLGFVVLYAPTFRWLFARWTLSVWQNAHGLFVLPLAAWLASIELKQCRSFPVEGSAWGFLFLVPAMALQAVDAGLHTQLLSAVSFLIALPGMSLLFLGPQRTRAIRFPLLFTWFALPIPLGLTERLTLVLREFTAHSVAAALPIIGLPVYLDGTTLQLAHGGVEVADACSGFSTLYAALATACLTAYMARTTIRRALPLVGAAPIAIASNILRVGLLVALVEWRGESILHTFLHPLSGMLTFALALPLIFWLGGDVEPKKAAT
jgi:exosortase